MAAKKKPPVDPVTEEPTQRDPDDFFDLSIDNARGINEEAQDTTNPSPQDAGINKTRQANPGMPPQRYLVSIVDNPEYDGERTPEEAVPTPLVFEGNGALLFAVVEDEDGSSAVSGMLHSASIEDIVRVILGLPDCEEISEELRHMIKCKDIMRKRAEKDARAMAGGIAELLSSLVPPDRGGRGGGPPS